MGTNLAPHKLTFLRELGQVHASRSGPFVDPGAVFKVKGILQTRGEEWAAQILGHDLNRRSRIDPSFPWLTDADMYTLIAADPAENDDAFDAMVARFNDEADGGQS